MWKLEEATDREKIVVFAVLEAAAELEEEMATSELLQDRLFLEDERGAVRLESAFVHRLERIEAAVLEVLDKGDRALGPGPEDLVDTEVRGRDGARLERRWDRQALGSAQLEVGDGHVLGCRRIDESRGSGYPGRLLEQVLHGAGDLGKGCG